LKVWQADRLRAAAAKIASFTTVPRMLLMVVAPMENRMENSGRSPAPGMASGHGQERSGKQNETRPVLTPRRGKPAAPGPAVAGVGSTNRTPAVEDRRASYWAT
jgi:hypothetical protein